MTQITQNWLKHLLNRTIFFQIKHSLVLHTGSFATLHAIAAKLYWLLAGQDNSLIY